MLYRPIIVTAIVSSLATTVLADTHPAAYAANAFAAIASSVSCATTGACVSGSNTSSGPGISGTSAKGYGVEGVSTSNDGLKGISTSSNGMSASSTSAFGAKGLSSTSYGVYGASLSNSGVYGQTSATGSKQSGIVGKDLTTNFGTNDGVFGTVTNGGWGVEGESGDGSRGGGVVGGATTATGVEGISQSGTGVFASTSTSDRYTYAMFAQSTSGGLLLSTPVSGFTITAFNQTSDNPIFTVTGNGDVTYAGSLQQVTDVGRAEPIESFGTTTTRPTVEDTGTAQLRNGVAVVTLDAAFVSIIDTTAAYRVFVTPSGDTRGLYVASRTPRGFVVREAQGGRSATAFDYRIVAIKVGHAAQRIGALDPATRPKRPPARSGISSARSQ